MKVKKQQLELDRQQWAGSKLGKEYVKAVYCHPAHLTYMQSTSCKMSGWMKHKLESTLPGEIINNLRYTDDTTLMVEIEEELKNILMRMKRENEKAGLKFNIQKTKIERTRWHRSRWMWSTSLSRDISGIHLQTQKYTHNIS